MGQSKLWAGKSLQRSQKPIFKGKLLNKNSFKINLSKDWAITLGFPGTLQEPSPNL